MAKKPAKKKAAAPKKGAGKSAAPKKTVQPSYLLVSKVQSASRPKRGTPPSYTYSEFLENVKNFCGLAKRSQAKAIVEDIAMFVKDSLRKGYKIPLLGLGKMYVRQTKARMGRNPATGEVIHISPKKRVRFTAAKALKEAVL